MGLVACVWVMVVDGGQFLIAVHRFEALGWVPVIGTGFGVVRGGVGAEGTVWLSSDFAAHHSSWRAGPRPVRDPSGTTAGQPAPVDVRPAATRVWTNRLKELVCPW